MNRDSVHERRFVSTTFRATVSFLVFVAAWLVGMGASTVGANVSPVAVSLLSSNGQTISTVRLHAQSPDLVIVKLSNNTDSPSSSQVDPTLSFTTSPGISVSAVEQAGSTIYREGSRTWPCTPGSTTVCRLTDPSGAPYVIPANSSVLAAVILSSGAVTPGTPGLALSVTGSLHDLGAGSASATVVMNTPSSPISSTGLRLLTAGDPVVRAGSSAVLTYTLANGSRTTVGGSASHAAPVTLTKLLPKGVTGWQATGSSWTCSGPQNGSPTCTTSSSIDPGAESSALTITYSEAPGVAATADHPIAPRYLLWQVGVSAALANGRVVTGRVRESVGLQARVAGHLSVFARITGSSVLTPGAATTLKVSHRSIDGMTSGIIDRVHLPAGLSVASPTTSKSGWICPAGRGTITCTHPSTMAAKASLESFRLHLTSSTDAPLGVRTIRVSTTATNGEATSSASAPLFFLSFGGPRLALSRVASASRIAPLTDGAPLHLVTGRQKRVTYVATNAGNRSITPGAIVHVTARLTPAATSLLAAAAAANDPSTITVTRGIGPGVCSSLNSGKVSCSMVLTHGLAPGASTPAVSFAIKVGIDLTTVDNLTLSSPVRSELSLGRLFTIRARVTGDPSITSKTTQDLTVITGHDSALEPALTTSAQPSVGGGPVVATARLENFSTAPRSSTTMTITIPPSLRAAADLGSACTVEGQQGGGQLVTCSAGTLGAATAGAPGTRPTPAVSQDMTFLLTDLSATGTVKLTATSSDANALAPSSTTILLRTSTVTTTQLRRPSDLVLTAAGTGPGDVLVTFRTPSNAPANQHYEATICSDPAMTDSCSTHNVTVNRTISGLNPGATVYGTVTAIGSTGYLAATSDVASVTLPSAPSSALTPRISSSPPSLNPAPTMGVSGEPSITTTAPAAPTIAMGTAAPSVVAQSTPRTATTPASVGQSFCDLVASLNIASPPTSLSVPLGGQISATLNDVSLSGTSCSAPATTISFSSGTLNLFGSYTMTVGSGSITTTGFSFTTASMTTPSAWGGGSETVDGTDLSLAFGGTEGQSTVAAQGTLTSSGSLGLPLAPGWSGATTLTFVSTQGVTSSITMSASVTNGSSSLTMSGTATLAGTYQATVSGAMSLDGVTVSNVTGSWTSGATMAATGTIAIAGSSTTVSVAYTDAVHWSVAATGTLSVLGTTTAALTGSFSEAGSGIYAGSFATSVSAALPSQITAQLTLSWAPSSAGVLTGSGSLALGAQGSLSATLTYASATDYTFTVSGQTTLDQATLSNVSGTLSQSGVLSATADLTIGGAALGIALSYSNPATWSMTANSTLSMFGSASAAASGSVTDVAGVITGAFTISMSEVTIAPGLTATFTTTWAPTTVVNGTTLASGGLAGSSSLTAGSSGTLAATFTYTSASNYAFTISSGSMTLGGMALTGVTGSYGSSTSLLCAGTLAVVGQSIQATVTFTSDTDWSVAVSTTITLFATSFQFQGSIAESTPANSSTPTVTGAFSASVTASLGNGMTLTAAMSWTPTGGMTGTGRLKLGNPGSLTATVTYLDAADYAFALSGYLNLSGLAMSNVSGTYGIGSLTPSGTIYNMVFSASTSLAGTSLDVSVAYKNGGTWSFATSDTFDIFGVQLSAGGTVAEVGGTSTGTLTFTLDGPITVAPGASITSISLTWSPTAGSLAGTADLTLGGATIALSATYADASDWSLAVTTGSSGVLHLGPGFEISGAAFTGTLSEASGVVAWAMTASLSSATLISDVDGFTATLGTTTLTLASSCVGLGSSIPCPSGTNSLYVGITSTLTATLGGGLGTQTMTITGAYGMTTESFVVTGTLSKISIASGLLVITGATLEITHGTGTNLATGAVSFSGSTAGDMTSGYSVWASGHTTLNLPGDTETVDVTFTYANGGFVVIATLPSGGTLGSTGAQLGSMAYVSTAGATISLSGVTQTMSAAGLVFGGTVAAPSWLLTYLGLSSTGSVGIYASYTSSLVYSVSAVFDIGLPVSTGSSDFSFSFSSFTLTMGSNGSGPYQQVSATGTMGVSGSAGSSTIAVTAGLSYVDATATVAGSISAQGVDGTSIWDNAFGLEGLDLTAFAISLSVELATTPLPLPGLGLAGTFTLGGSSAGLWDFLGVKPGASLTAVVDLQASSPCMELQIGSSTSSTTAINLLNLGVVTATYGELVIAPDGCQVGIYTVDPGINLVFEGAFLGTSVSVQADVGVGASPTISATLDIGTFTAGPVTFDSVTACVAAGVASTVAPCSDIQTGTTAVFGFSGALSVLDTSVQLSGAVTATAMTLSGSLDNLTYEGFGISTLTFAGTYESSPLSFSLTEAGQFDIFGQALDETAAFSYANGQIDTMSFSIDLPSGLTITDGVSLTGTMSFYASSITQEVEVEATGSLEISGFSLVISSCADGAPGLTISTTGVSLCSATMTISGLMTATVSGQLWWGTPPSGSQITDAVTGVVSSASQGDFSFSAENVGATVSGFGALGSVSLSQIGGTFAAELNVGLYLSNTSSDPAVSVTGWFDSSGHFDLTGVGALTLAGLSLDLAIEAAYLSGGTAAVNGSTTIDVAGATAAVSGSFTSSTSGVSVSLLGTGDLAPNGFDLGQVTVALAMTPTAEDVSLSGSLSLGGIFTVGLSSTVGVVGGQVGFYLTLDAGIAIPGIGIGGQLTLTNCTDDTCSTLTSFSAQVAGQFSDYSGAAYSFGQFAVSQDWSFQISASGYTNQCSGVVNTGANEWQSCFVGGYSVGLATWSPYLSFSAGFSINFEAANWQVNTSCSGSWYPSSWNCNTSSYFGGWYTIATVGVSVDSNGNMSASFDGVNLSVNV